MFVAFATNRVKDRNFCARAVREFLCRRVLVIFGSKNSRGPMTVMHHFATSSDMFENRRQRNSSFTPILQVATKAQHLSDLNS